MSGVLERPLDLFPLEIAAIIKGYIGSRPTPGWPEQKVILNYNYPKVVSNEEAQVVDSQPPEEENVDVKMRLAGFHDDLQELRRGRIPQRMSSALDYASSLFLVDLGPRTACKVRREVGQIGVGDGGLVGSGEGKIQGRGVSGGKTKVVKSFRYSELGIAECDVRCYLGSCQRWLRLLSLTTRGRPDDWSQFSWDYFLWFCLVHGLGGTFKKTLKQLRADMIAMLLEQPVELSVGGKPLPLPFVGGVKCWWSHCMRSNDRRRREFAQVVVQSKRLFPAVTPEMIESEVVESFNKLTLRNPEREVEDQCRSFDQRYPNAGSTYSTGDLLLTGGFDARLGSFHWKADSVLTVISQQIVRSVEELSPYLRGSLEHKEPSQAGRLDAKRSEVAEVCYVRDAVSDARMVIPQGLGSWESPPADPELVNTHRFHDWSDLSWAHNPGWNLRHVTVLHPTRDDCALPSLAPVRPLLFPSPVGMGEEDTEFPWSRNEVELVGLPEPVKVRTISKGSAEVYNHLLQFQKQLWGIKKHPVFRLIGSPTGSELRFIAERIGVLLPRELVYSIDYSDATNNLHPYLSEVCVSALSRVCGWSREDSEVISESLLHATIRDPLRSEEPRPQTWGQLMGHCLSFPVLCIINAAILRYAYEQVETLRLSRRCRFSLTACPMLVNGDDAVLRADSEFFSYWEPLTKICGLETSQSKTWCSKKFFTINSVMFERGIICFPDALWVLVEVPNVGQLAPIPQDDRYLEKYRTGIPGFDLEIPAGIDDEIVKINLRYHSFVNTLVGSPSHLRWHELFLRENHNLIQSVLPSGASYYACLESGGLGLPVPPNPDTVITGPGSAFQKLLHMMAYADYCDLELFEDEFLQVIKSRSDPSRVKVTLPDAERIRILVPRGSPVRQKGLPASRVLCFYHTVSIEDEVPTFFGHRNWQAIKDRLWRILRQRRVTPEQALAELDFFDVDPFDPEDRVIEVQLESSVCGVVYDPINCYCPVGFSHSSFYLAAYDSIYPKTELPIPILITPRPPDPNLDRRIGGQ